MRTDGSCGPAQLVLTAAVARRYDVEAVVTEVGGGLRSLRAAGRDLIAGFLPDQLRPVYGGAVLAPWPNRVADGRYTWDGQQHQLALNEPDRRNALHGLVAWAPWTPTRVDDSSAVLTTRLRPQPGYPFQLDLTATYDSTPPASPGRSTPSTPASRTRPTEPLCTPTSSPERDGSTTGR
jgi:hypothetical protein